MATPSSGAGAAGRPATDAIFTALADLGLLECGPADREVRYHGQLLETSSLGLANSLELAAERHVPD